MKKLFFAVALVACLSLFSCSKSPQDYKNEIEKLEKEHNELVSEGKMEEASKVEEKAKALIGEMIERSLKDPEFAKELKELD